MNLTKESTKIEDGIPIYADDVYWGKLSKGEMEESLDVIDKKGWGAFDSKYGGKFDFTYEEDRADWHFNLNIDKNSKVLDIGAGMGRSTIPLARVAGEVFAFDMSIHRMRFLKRRIKQESLNNVTIFVGDIFDLPLPDGSFDVIAMNGILEWVGKTKRYENPKTAQIEALKICKKLLKKNGQLYVGIENRFALAYLKGVDHSGLRFTSYMPKPLANVYMKLRKKERYDTYIYTKRGLEKLFVEAGFNDIETYLPYPGYNLPRILIPYDNIFALRHVISKIMSTNTFSKKFIKIFSYSNILLKIYRHFFFSFNVIAKNDD
jgi:ubiquinone/menaquinone biosynthesis C-methylase UbiE